MKPIGNSHCLIACSVALGLTLFALPATATPFAWNTGNGQFTASGNWVESGHTADPGGVPSNNDTVVFSRGNVPLYLVSLEAELNPKLEQVTVDRLLVGNNLLTLVGFAGSSLTVDSTNIAETGRAEKPSIFSE